ncbi:MAG: hypothetical protein AAGA44_09285 [Pseudomonadota bacterium]
MRRNILAYAAGILVTVVTIMLVQSVGHQVFPVDGDVDINVHDTDAMRDYMAALPAGAILFVAAAWVAGVIAGNAVAMRIGRLKRIYFSTVITSFVLAGAVSQFFLVPHPTWFILVSVVGIIAAGVVSLRLPSGQTA